MQLIRGTTPEIEVTVVTDIDLHQAAAVWIYISQQNKVKVDKKITDVTFDYENRKMSVKLTQEDTLGLKEGEALFQIRLLLLDGTALATLAYKTVIKQIYKEGEITPEE